MAAYAALVSLRHIIEHIEHHPHPPISLDKLQIQSLSQKLTFLQDFLEGYNNVYGEADHHHHHHHHHVLESRICDAAYAAEDIIESRLVDQILAVSKRRRVKISSIDLYQRLQIVIREMEMIKKEAMDIKEKKRLLILDDDHHLHMIHSSISAASLKPPAAMVGFDDVMIDVMDKLTGQQSDRQIIPIVGMGGMGKTTLTRNIYVNPLIVQHFDFVAWTTISQDYSIREIFSDILVCLVRNQVSKEAFSERSEYELGLILHKRLSGRRYLIVMDDVWSVEVWDDVKFYLPDNNNGSRVMITTRLSKLGVQLNCSHRVDMSFLDEDESWDLLCKTVFGDGISCPLELEEIGKKIASNCKGLPLSIVVIGGVLAKSQKTQKYWEYIAENLNSIVNLEDDERCLKILNMSYNQLPVHLKPCFLYMGAFREDAQIRVSSLIKLWVAEGFLKRISGESLEVVARHYLEELIDRNLVLVRKFGSAGNIKVCTIHDLLRDLCLREAKKDGFLNIMKVDDISPDTSKQRRIYFPESMSISGFMTYYMARPEIPELHVRALLSSSFTRSLICDSPLLLSPRNARLLRVFKPVDPLSLSSLGSLEDIFQLVNSRYIGIKVNWHEIPSNYLSSVHLMWNLQTLIVEGPTITAPAEIWSMSRLRHVQFRRLELPDPPQINGRDDAIVLNDLQTMSTVFNFECGEEVVKRIPNIKKLRIINHADNKELRLDNLGLLRKLESLCCAFRFEEGQNRNKMLMKNLTFPCSLKKLSLLGSRLRWEDMIRTEIGSLPHLQVLKLKKCSFIGSEWETVKGQFCSLKYLLIEECFDLEYWTTDSTHFPRLEHIVLRYLGKLKGIPLEIGEITTLKSIHLEYCSDLANFSAKKISEEQEELGNPGLEVRIQVQPW